METGYEPFAQQPVYIGYSPSGVGTQTFGSHDTGALVGAASAAPSSIRRAASIT